MEKARVGWAVAVLVLMLAMLPLLGLATKLLGDGTGRQFYIEPSSAAYETAAAGQNMMGGGFALFAGLSLLSFALLRNWWVAAGLIAPVIAGTVGSMVFTTYGGGLAAFLGVPFAFVGALAGFGVSVDRLVREIRANRARPSTAE